MRYGHQLFTVKLNDRGISIVDKAVKDSNINLEKSTLALQTRKNRDTSNDKKIRSSKNSWIDNQNLLKFLNTMCLDINRLAEWNLKINGCEDIQYGVYEVGDYYDWHVDQDDHLKPYPVWKDGKCIKFPGCRKMTVSLMLTGPDEYEGGELDLYFGKPSEFPKYDSFKLAKYEAIFFQSDVWHRVQPVKSGLRKSLVTWFYGPPYV
jgi:PKHD-type hydroxylase